MVLLRKVVLVLLINSAFLAMPSISMAGEEISQESVIAALNKAIATSEEIVVAIQGGTDAEAVEQLYKTVRYTVKAVVISDSKSAVPLSRANKKMKKSRKAFRNGDMDNAATLAEEGVSYFKKTLANKI